MEKNNQDVHIAHIGFGAFHKAHQAYYTNIVNNLSDQKWNICAISLFSGRKAIQDLKAQNYKFSILEKSFEHRSIHIIDSVVEGLHPEDVGIENIIKRLASPEIKIISLTLTEKGYCFSSQSDGLDIENELIKHDLNHPTTPRSAIGVLVAALKLRMNETNSSVTILSCDNMSENGAVTKKVILDYAAKSDKNLAFWISKNVSFPNTMVDRIVPAMSSQGRDEIRKYYGKEDLIGVICEPFHQWVIEDNFIAGRPQWEKAGVQFVQNVLPYEEMKLRLLNASHSFLAYVGSLLGYEYIDRCLEDERLQQATKELMQEQMLTLDSKLDIDLPSYADRLIERFKNPSIKHKTAQIAMDGSQKIPQRVIAPLNHLINIGVQPRWLLFLIASWMHYIRRECKNTGRECKKGESCKIIDPLSQQFETIKKESSADEYINKILSIKEIFGTEIIKNTKITSKLKEIYDQIDQEGISKAMNFYLSIKERTR